MSEESEHKSENGSADVIIRHKDPPNRRAFLVGATSVLGMAAVNLLLSPHSTQAQDIPDDPTKVPDALATAFGSRSRFERAKRLTNPQRCNMSLRLEGM